MIRTCRSPFWFVPTHDPTIPPNSPAAVWVMFAQLGAPPSQLGLAPLTPRTFFLIQLQNEKCGIVACSSPSLKVVNTGCQAFASSDHQASVASDAGPLTAGSNGTESVTFAEGSTEETTT